MAETCLDAGDPHLEEDVHSRCCEAEQHLVEKDYLWFHCLESPDDDCLNPDSKASECSDADAKRLSIIGTHLSRGVGPLILLLLHGYQNNSSEAKEHANDLQCLDCFAVKQESKKRCPERVSLPTYHNKRYRSKCTGNIRCQEHQVAIAHQSEQLFLFRDRELSKDILSCKKAPDIRHSYRECCSDQVDLSWMEAFSGNHSKSCGHTCCAYQVNIQGHEGSQFVIASVLQV